MTKNEMIMLHERIVNDYKTQIFITYDETIDRGYAYLTSRRIMLPARYKSNPDTISLFTTLHEIGHLMTNNKKQKRYLQEYLATQWAINRAKEYRLFIPKNIISMYQNYIWDWRETCVKKNGKNIHSREELTLII